MQVKKTIGGEETIYNKDNTKKTSDNWMQEIYY